MTRTHGRILCSILDDKDFQELSVSAQRLYFILLAQPMISTTGALSLTARRWSMTCKNTTPDDILKSLHELDESRFVLIDEDTEECLVRSYIRGDNIIKQPQMLSNALRRAHEVKSPRLRAALATELRRLGREDAAQVADELAPPESGPPDRPGTEADTRHSPIQAQATLPSGSEQATSTPPSGSPIQADGSLTAGWPQRRGEGVRFSGLGSVGFNSSSRSKPEPEDTCAKICDSEQLPVVADDQPNEPPELTLLDSSEAVVPISRRADETFARFWAAYPRKKAKPRARTAWDKAVKRIDPESIIGSAQRLAASKPDLKFTPYPATWLNNDSWDDEPDPVSNGGYQGYQEPADHSVYYKGLLS